MRKAKRFHLLTILLLGLSFSLVACTPNPTQTGANPVAPTNTTGQAPAATTAPANNAQATAIPTVTASGSQPTATSGQGAAFGRPRDTATSAASNSTPAATNTTPAASNPTPAAIGTTPATSGTAPARPTNAPGLPNPNATPVATGGNASAAVPTIPGTIEIQVPPSVNQEFFKQLGVSDNGKFFLRMYVSTSVGDKLAEDAHGAVLKSGYQFGIPGFSELIKQEDAFVGLYTKSGAPDLMMVGGAVTGNTTDFGDLEISKEELEKIKAQFKDAKSILLFVGGTNLINTIGGAATIPEPDATANPNPNPARTPVPSSGTPVSRTPVPASSPVSGTPAATVPNGGYKFTINKAEKLDKIGSDTPLAPNSVFLAVDVTLLSEIDKGVNASSFYASVKDASGKVYDASLLIERNPTFPEEEDLPKGKQVRGWMIFEVDKNVTNLTFLYQPFTGNRVNIELPINF
jgi:Domain of unknown function (DUF4352)